MITYDTPIIKTTNLAFDTTDTTTQPTETTENIQTDNAMTDLQPETETKTETESETDTEKETTIKPPTLNSYKKMVYSLEGQRHILY